MEASLVFVLLFAALALLISLIAHPLHGHINSSAFQFKQIPPPEGVYLPNDILTRAMNLAEHQLAGPEDMAFAADGSLFVSTNRGWIQRIWPNQTVEDWVFLGGSLLGLEWTQDGSLVVCNNKRGLLLVSPDKQVRVLTTGVEGQPFLLVNNADVARDGRIYFSDSSSKYGNLAHDFLEHKPHGRLLRYDPHTAATEVLLSGLYMANGVALSQREDFVLICESWMHRVTRLWLEGPAKGSTDILVENLPGLPDNINLNPDGTFWIGLILRRSKNVDVIHQLPVVKNLAAYLPPTYHLYSLPTAGWLLKVDESGNVLESFEDAPAGKWKMVTGAREHEGFLYFGSKGGDTLGRLELDPVE